MTDLLTAFVVIFLAEFGDKSQLLVLTQGARYEVKKIFLGISVTIMLLQLVSVGAGQLLASWLRQDVLGIQGSTWLDILTAALFAVFGVITLRHALGQTVEEDDDESAGTATSLLGFLALYFISEFGDKTNVTTFALAATHNPIMVWIGSSAGFIATSAVALFASRYISKYLSMKAVMLCSAVIFLLLALFQILGFVWE